PKFGTMSELLTSQFDVLLVIVMLRGVLVVLGLTPIAARTEVSPVPADALEYQATSRLPLLLATRSAGRNARPPRCTRATVTGLCCTRCSEPSLKLCSKMSPFRWRRASFHTMLTVPRGLLTAIRGKSLSGNRL